MKKLNENERTALDAIVETCDDLDGDLFTRLEDAMEAVTKALGGNWKRTEDRFAAGWYIADLMKEGYLDEEPDEFYGMGLWVNA